MPHVVVKIATERTAAEKQDLAVRVTKAVTDALGHDPDDVSVAIEDYAPEAWMHDVYEPEIAGRAGSLFKRPGYASLAAEPDACA